MPSRVPPTKRARLDENEDTPNADCMEGISQLPREVQPEMKSVGEQTTFNDSDKIIIAPRIAPLSSMFL